MMQHYNIGDFFRPAVERDGDAVAIIDLCGIEPRTFTYVELETRVQRAVGVLSALSLRSGDRIALALPNSVQFLEIFLAAMRLGAVPVLVNFQLSEAVLRFILKDSASRALITDPVAAPACAAVGEDLRLEIKLAPGAVRSGWCAYDQLVAGARADTTVELVGASDQAFQPYTAGSTGQPKGICLTHGGVSWGIEHSQKYWPVRPSERGIVAAPMYHKNAMRGTIKPLLRAGGSVVIQSRFEPRAFLRGLAGQSVTYCGGVPAMFAELLNHADLLASEDFSPLRGISLGSSNVPAELITRLEQAFPDAEVKESYGLTEGNGPLRSPLDGRKTPRGSVGVCAPETEVMLIDDCGLPAAQGELWVRSPYVLKEYVNRPDLNRERLRDGWLRTGDLFRRDADGFYYFLGRTDDMFVCGGENIYPKEIESLILSHPDVADVVVAPLPHATKGEAPAAAVVTRHGISLQPEHIQDHCAKHGPPFAIPRAVLVLDAIPLTAAGKPDRQAVRGLLATTFGTLISRNARGELRR